MQWLKDKLLIALGFVTTLLFFYSKSQRQKAKAQAEKINEMETEANAMQHIKQMHDDNSNLDHDTAIDKLREKYRKR